MQMKALNNLESMITQTPALDEPTKQKMLLEVEEAGKPLDTDKWIYRMVVGALGLAILACLSFTFYITLKSTAPNVDLEMPEIFMAIGSAAVGALAGLLAPSPGRNGN